MIPLASREGGQGEPLLLYLHGLNANREVWDRLDSVAAESWAGRRVAVDLPGHGKSDSQSLYSYGASAASVAATVSATFGKSGPVSIIGHSMGGVVALALASGWFGLDVDNVLAFGTKVQWTEKELGRLRELAERPAKRFKSREEAAMLFLRVSGLEGLVEPTDPVVERGVVQHPRGDFGLATDPAANAIGAPSVSSLTGAAQAKARLACGSRDPLVGVEELRAYDPAAEEWDGLGHNVHVEAPELVWESFQRLG